MTISSWSSTYRKILARNLSLVFLVTQIKSSRRFFSQTYLLFYINLHWVRRFLWCATTLNTVRLDHQCNVITLNNSGFRIVQWFLEQNQAWPSLMWFCARAYQHSLLTAYLFLSRTIFSLSLIFMALRKIDDFRTAH